ncbi:MAG: hypothetical protein ACLP50_10855 [Solirubrobacteraceae bacterium]
MGPVRPEVLEAFLQHYRSAGVEAARLALHMGEEENLSLANDLTGVARRFDAQVMRLVYGPWNEDLNPDLRDQLRALDPPGTWHILADVDEFHQYPMSVSDLVEAAELQGAQAIPGLLLDRFAADGTLAPFPRAPHAPDGAFPLGAFFTGRISGGDPRKIVLATSDAEVAPGQHWARARGEARDLFTLVHHFKWHASVATYLKERKDAFACGRWREDTPAMREEASRVLDLLSPDCTRIQLDGAGIRPTPCSVHDRNLLILAAARELYDEWSRRFE